MNADIIIQAHRGVSTECPENTIPAFLTAIAQGYGIIELDPNYTKDGEIVILHDKTLNRTARLQNGTEISEKIAISDITYAEALEYDFGISFSPKYKGVKLPLLEEALQLAEKNNVKIKLDSKIEAFPDFATEKLYSIIEKYEDIIALTSGSVERIEFYADRFPKAEIHYDGKVDEATISRLSALSPRLTVWMPYECKLTSWVKVPYADEKLCREIKKVAKLGIWIIKSYEDFDEIVEKFDPDVVENTGVIKPLKNAGMLADMHSHSKNSLDSQCNFFDSVTSAINKKISALALTDHCDIQFYESRNMPALIQGSVNDAAAAREKFGDKITVLTGIELGESTWNKAAAEEILAAHDYDVVIGSVHELRYKNLGPYAKVDFALFTEEELHEFLDEYFCNLEKTIKYLPCDIMAHLTVPLRYINGKYNRGVTLEKYDGKINEILRYIITHGIALEVNTSGIGTAFDTFMPDEALIKRYKDMGGYLITIGADAHAAQNIGNGFNRAIELLKKLGFRNCFYYQNRMAIQCTL